MDLVKEKKYAKHYEDSILISAPEEELFLYVDDHSKFSSHMMQSSWMMGGAQMKITVDEGRGQKVGSHIGMGGKVLGITLYLDEVVTRREPPFIKTWETVGDVKLLVIGHYRMGIAIKPSSGGSLLKVFIDYDLPSKLSWLGKLFGGMYAKWCVHQMIDGTRNYFLDKR